MSIIESYIKRTSWRIKENASSGYSLGAMNHFLSGRESALYWLNDVYPSYISEAHKGGDIHIHDLSMIASYCNGWSLRQLLTEGLGGIENKVTSAPANHLITACMHIVNFLGIMANESAGAQALSSVDTYLAPFVKRDNLSYKRVKQAIQAMVFGLNVESRWSGQAPFSNVTFDWVVPNDMKDLAAICGGKPMNFTYGECQKEIDMINKAFLEIMEKGDAVGRIFSYPIPTYNITEDFNWDSENAELLFKMTAKYGTPYFQNFVGSDLDPADVRSMCCRLQLDKRELQKRGGGLFGANEFTGSVGVVTINMPRLGHLCNSKENFIKSVGHMMDIARDSLEIKRSTLERLRDFELYPYTTRYLEMGWKNHFSTIGLVGMNEACLNLFGKDIATKEGIEFTVEVLKFMKDRIAHYQEKTGNLYNLEATPAEGTSFRLAKHDVKKYDDIIHQGTKHEPYYTNSTQLPVGITDDLFTALDWQEPIQKMYTGGTVFHAFLGEEMDPVCCKKIVKKIATSYSIPYFSITPTFSICADHGYLHGEVCECPICGKETEVYSRIVGYYRPIKNWNHGKSREYKDRVVYKTLSDKEK